MPVITNTINSILARKHKMKTQKRTPHQVPTSTGIRCYPLRIGPGVELISTIHELMEDIVVPLFSLLRKSIIHNDANDYNIIIIDEDNIGLIDFGDMC
ncbi:unnamed protein product, partial [Rotaria sordida]